ncbi:Conidiation-specific protein 6 [Madurella mycetomatis]|uniref:Conidiation-specific protein 6 n=1 Tax=Madurella mycetomatis TaxID=100816 RepID=A0A175VP33_9PEZI|nr:Conidiation-specific protein 6 [Madurella mycetomatis]
MADQGNRERGLRAALSNPRVSEEAKQHDREILESEFGEHIQNPQSGQIKRRASSGKSSSIGLHSSSSVEETPQGSSTGLPSAQSQTSGGKARRASTGEARSTLHEMSEGKDRGNVIRGLKAALKNPHVSEKAKEVDRKKLQELGEPVD